MNKINGEIALQYQGEALPALLPTQALVLTELESRLQCSGNVAFGAHDGTGRTTVSKHLAARYGGYIIGREQFALRDLSFRNRLQAGGYAVMARMMREALARHDLLIIEDFAALDTGGSNMFYRGFYKAIRAEAHAANKRLVTTHQVTSNAMESFASDEEALRVIKGRLREDGEVATVLMPDLIAEDYESFLRSEFPNTDFSQVDFDVVYRYASRLRLFELKLACHLMLKAGSVTTPALMGALETYVMYSNTSSQEVEKLTFDTLPGSEDIAEQLDTHVVLPFENVELAQKLGLKPKRGVLLFGPPGTGKTSIGRALAQRMKGKFFMIDGSIITEPPSIFIDEFQRIVGLAKENSPSVLFIDDADELFGIHHVSGVLRYLLSLLDGLESESAGGVCVMMTAMDARKMPDALLRSGRVELWLETRRPDADTRAKILERWVKPGLPTETPIDFKQLGAMTDGFTPADLRRIAADARLLYAGDLQAGGVVRNANEYMKSAARDIIQVHAQMDKTLNKTAEAAC